MKILITGFGSIGRRHFRNFQALGVEDFIFLRSGRSMLDDAEIAPYPVETDLQAALAHQPDAVVIANPTALHLDIAIPAAQAGCHIMLEKPISHSLDRVDQLRDAVERSGSRVLVGFQFRYHPGLERIRAMLSDAAIGEVVSARAHWGEYLPDWHPWEDYRQAYAARPDLGGGVILTLCHPFDYLRWLLGEFEVAWASTSNRTLNLPVEDTAEIALQFASGAIGSLHLDYIQRPPSHHLEIIGTNGTIRWDNADGIVKHFQADQPNPEWQNHPMPVGFERNDLFKAQAQHFIAVCRRNAIPICTLADGQRALELALTARSYE